MRAFSIDLDQFRTDVKRKMQIVPRAVVLRILRGVVNKTPVDTGRARGGWQVDIGQIPTGETGVEDPDGSDTIAEGLRTIEQWDTEFASIFIVNNVVYIEPLESGEHSKRAPQGMLAVTIREFPYLVEEAVNEELS